MTLKNFAWMLHGNDEGEQGGQRRMSVNWVMPGDGTFGQEVALRASDAFDGAGDLMWPWKMTIEEWWQATPGSVGMLATQGTNTLSDPHALQATMEAEVRRKCSACESAFSSATEHLEPAPSCATLPHVFAPMTHLPAGVSHDILGMSRSFLIDSAELPTACAPQFTVRVKGRTARFTPAQVLPSYDAQGQLAYLTIGYQAAYPGDDRAVEAPKFSVLMQPIRPSPDATALSTTLHAAERGEVGARAMLASLALAPLPMLARALTADPIWGAGSVAPGALPGRALGPGLLRIDEGRQVLIWDRVPVVATSAAAQLASWTEDDKVLATLGAAWAADDSGLSGSDRQLLAPLFQPGREAPRPGSEAPRMARAVGTLLNDAQARKSLMRAWLAAVAVTCFTTPTQPFRFWLEQLTPVLHDDSLAELQSAWWMYRLGQQFPAQAAGIAQIEAIAERWIAGKMAPTDLAELTASYLMALGLLTGTTSPMPGMDAALIAKALAALQERLRLPDAQRPVSLGEDRDLAVEIVFPDPAAASGDADEALRGFAIAMASGFDVPNRDLGMAWITDTAAWVLVAPKTWKPIAGANGAPLRMHDTVGATRQNGRSVVTFPYAGKPLSGAMNAGGGTVGSDGIDALDFAWPDSPDWRPPKLAYGLRYWSTGTAIGNGGAILNRDVRDGAERRLKPASALSFPVDGEFRYLCRVAPGAISLKPTSDLYLMETQARAWHRQLSPATSERCRVGVICPGGPGWHASAPQSLSFELVAPDATPLVLDRWIEADIAQRIVPAFGALAQQDPASAGLDANRLEHERAAMLARMRQKPFADAGRAVRVPRHPAVRAIGVRAHFDDGTPAVSLQIAPLVKIGEGYMPTVEAYCKADAHRSGATVVNGKLNIALQAGVIARVRFVTLVPEMFFAAPGNDEPLARMADLGGVDVWTDGDGQRWRAFSLTEHWFECLPTAANMLADTRQALESVQEHLAFEADGNDEVAQLSRADGVDAHWLNGFLVQRHEWHWTGYPLALPKRLDGKLSLEDWTEAFAGTESLRESQVHLVQTNRHNTGRHWRFGTLTEAARFSRLRLPERHGARFFACVMRPMLRFEAWLAPTARATLERIVIAKGRLVPARIDWNDPMLRLGPPTVRTAIPLIRSFASDGAGVRAGANGTLLCLDDVLCRTDALARFGGVGEIIEVDLEETRINNVFEIGPNPIFHAGPQGALPYATYYAKDGTPLPRQPIDWGIEADRPFGLTYDTDSNPKVAQTAIIVRAIGNDVGAYWIMAKVRLRRMLDPHEAWTAGAALTDWQLGRRTEGDDRIPFDFVVEVPPGEPFTLALGTAAGTHFDPVGAVTQGRRLLCSWHKGRWNSTSELVWGVQVREQLLREEGAQWINVGRYSPYETRAATTGLSMKSGEPVALRKDTALAARRLLLSDYGEPHWLTFIGSPLRHPSMADQDFSMTCSAANVIELERTSAVSGIEVISRDLLINPVKLDQLSKTPVSERAMAESNRFHLLLVFAPVNDVAAPPGGQHLGQLAGVYQPTRQPVTEQAPYPPLQFVPYREDSTMPDGALAYIYTFQSTGENPPDWQTLEACLFPPLSKGEATVRWLPEFIGPISSDRVTAKQTLRGKPVRIDLAQAGKIDLEIDVAAGWRHKGSTGKHWQDDLDGGLCTQRASGGLILEGGGGRLLAELEGWSASGRGKVVAYDANGAQASGTWTATG